ncbi:uncharacterized protein LOC110876346 [Helianthus annuus]|uniref:uncharacterized protein LOC110876346 n=1 Tax=Helianthus annuus TaxID=4232 RepID=UPI0016532535|nr:uncharacterized protein LOC110876346 [Helianthus annuus]
MVMKGIVEDADEGTSQPQPKRRKYIVRERGTANDLLKWYWTERNFFFANGVEYKYSYYLDEIYPEYDVFLKSFSRDGTLYPKRIKFNKVQMAARKDIDRAFGVLQKRWRIWSMPCRLYEKDQIRNMMYACIILHNMILEDEGRAIVEYYGEEPKTNNEYISDENRTQNQYLIESRQIKSNLQADLVKHVSTLPPFDFNEDEDKDD